MWDAIIEATRTIDEDGQVVTAGSPEYGDRVFYALSLMSYIDDWKDTHPQIMSEITLDEWADMQIVRRKIKQIEEHAHYEQRQASKNPNK